MKRNVVLKWSLYFLVLVLMYRTGYAAAGFVETLSGKAAAGKGYVIVIDPGHGGTDPGKVGKLQGMTELSGEVLEKDINLQIALKLKAFLTQAGMQVYLTRESDCNLGFAGEKKGKGPMEASDIADKIISKQSGSKAEDMAARVAMINALQPDVTVSIHQNSYPEGSVKGGQIFYYGASEDGKKLAFCLQKALTELQTGNKRKPKANQGYYMLLKTNTPTVIAECGFLTNPEECSNLCRQEYQEQVAWKLYMGIVRYLKKR